ncbi:MAG: hypothetical protein AB7O37_15195 [Vicinamibacteria bacterium]
MLTGLMGLLAVAGLSLSLTASETSVLVGEPVPLTIAFTATDRDQTAKTTAVVVLIDAGAGYRPHFEARLSSDLLLDIGVDLQPGVPFRTGLVIAIADARRLAGDSFRFALPTPGTYRLRAKYGVVLSNEVVLSVVPPQGREAELYETYLKENPYLLTRWATETDEEVARLQDLLHRYEGSPYLYLPQIRSWMFEIRQAEVAFGRSGGRTSGESPLEHDVGTVLDKIQAVDWRSRPAFDASRLALIAETRLKWGDREGAFEVYRQLIERYPDAPLAQAGRRLIGADDETPPELAVSPNTAVLWPPNRAMIPINVSVSAADNSGEVNVTLVSITCNDACDPALDVSGAEYGTDDRSFVLRAERGGTSKEGRTYTITYTAEDAAGNKTSASTTVTAPHDQGKKK